MIYKKKLSGHHVRPHLRFCWTWANFGQPMCDDRQLFAALIKQMFFLCLTCGYSQWRQKNGCLFFLYTCAYAFSWLGFCLMPRKIQASQVDLSQLKSSFRMICMSQPKEIPHSCHSCRLYFRCYCYCNWVVRWWLGSYCLEVNSVKLPVESGDESAVGQWQVRSDFLLQLEVTRQLGQSVQHSTWSSHGYWEVLD